MEINKKIFREYDIRGLYPTEINEDIAYIIGKSYGSFIQEKLNLNTCVVGKDIRYSSDSLSFNVIKGIIDTGCNVVYLDTCTTPMYYYACQKTKYNIGIMVTASHNPKDDNGFKFSFDSLSNARGEMVYQFRDYTLANRFLTGKGKIAKYDIYPSYIKLLKNSTKMENKPLNVVIDCANATTAPFIKDIIKEFPNINPIYLFTEVDSSFPNHHPDPAVESNMEALKEAVKDFHADLGISYDGDGDRLGAVDNLGNYIATDKIMAILARDIIENSECKDILYDIKCSKLVEDVIISSGGTPHLNRSGASYTRYETNFKHYAFGGELAGHFTFNDRFPGIDSGIYASLRLMEILTKSNTTINELVSELPKYFNTPEIKIPTSDDIKFKIVNEVIDYCQNKKYEIITIDGVKVIFPDGWALIRASNTGPNLTLRFEANNEEFLKQINQEFSSLIDELKKSN